MRSGIISALISYSEGRPARQRAGEERELQRAVAQQRSQRAVEEQRSQRAVEEQRSQQPIRQEPTRTPILSRAQARQQRPNEDQERNEVDTHTHRIDMGEDDDDDSLGLDHYDEKFQDRRVRHKFIRNVYLILAIQLILTGGMACLFKFHKPSFLWMYQFMSSFFIGIAIATIAMLLLIGCCEQFRKTFPCNFIALFIFTGLEGLTVSFIVVHYPNDEVLLALGCTAAVCIALTIFAFQTKCDFTACWGVFFCGMVILLLMSIISFFYRNKTLQLVRASFGVAIISCYLIFDTQMIMGGKTKFQIEPDDYIMGAINLYLDIILLFYYILQLIHLTD